MRKKDEKEQYLLLGTRGELDSGREKKTKW